MGCCMKLVQKFVQVIIVKLTYFKVSNGAIQYVANSGSSSSDILPFKIVSCMEIFVRCCSGWVNRTKWLQWRKLITAKRGGNIHAGCVSVLCWFQVSFKAMKSIIWRSTHINYMNENKVLATRAVKVSSTFVSITWSGQRLLKFSLVPIDDPILNNSSLHANFG